MGTWSVVMRDEYFNKWWEGALISYALLDGCEDEEFLKSIKNVCHGAWLTSSIVTRAKTKYLQKGEEKVPPEGKDKGGNVRMILDVEGGRRLVLEAVMVDSEGNRIDPPSPAVVFDSPIGIKLEKKEG